MAAKAARWKPPTTFPQLTGLPWLSLDLETWDPHLRQTGSGWPRLDGYIAGISLSGPDFTGYYPVRHADGNLDPVKVFKWLKDQLPKFTGQLYGANIIYDLGWLAAQEKIRTPGAIIRDVQWCEALIDEDRPGYSLKALLQYYGLPPKDTTAMDEALLRAGFVHKDGKEKGKPDHGAISKLPSWEVGAYAERDTTAPVDVYLRQEAQIKAQGLEKIVDFEHRLMPWLIDTRLRGVRVDLARAEAGVKLLRTKELDHLDSLTKYGHPAPENIWSAEDVGKFCDAVGLVYTRTKTGQPSFTKDWLEMQDHPAFASVLAARKYNRAWSKFLQSDILESGASGRVHGELHPLRADRDDDGRKTGTGTGRFAASNPNLQQIPGRDPEIGPLVRSCYLPDEGGLWASLDYRQQEPRLTLHYAYLMKMPGAAEARQTFVNDPDTDYHQMVSDLTGVPRDRAKEINLGIPYGMGGGKLCKVYLKLPVVLWKTPSGKLVEVAGDEGKKILKQYHQRLPYLKKLMEDVEAAAKKRGYITTIGGRKKHFPLWQPSNDFSATPLRLAEAQEAWPNKNLRRAFTHKALNALIQGGSGDMIKKSIQDLTSAGYFVQIPVHDENCATVGSVEEAQKMAKIMENCMDLTVPLRVKVSVGKSWGEAKGI